MSENKKIKATLHPNNKNRKQYDLLALVKEIPELEKYVKKNKDGEQTVDFSDPIAVKLLNKALLSHYYDVKFWKFPDTNLCPPIPGRADYIHHMSDLLDESMRKGKTINCLDIGVGASCIYPIIGITEYNWNFIASDIDRKSIATAKKIISSNPNLKGKVDFRFQNDSNKIFEGILKEEDRIEITICNPPFHASRKEALEEQRKKVRNLTGKYHQNPKLNFSGASEELIYEGGEYQFIQNMIKESVKYANNCVWFSTLVSKKKNLHGIYINLKRLKVHQIKEIEIITANKKSRIIAWTFMTKREQKYGKKPE
jgi:23S rRNA (adenine1618-N6)-methyltransferase|tara:strand:- start:658 stop:1593 length:936 start_codon:yes stop_codon:yes gene_type:complete